MPKRYNYYEENGRWWFVKQNDSMDSSTIQKNAFSEEQCEFFGKQLENGGGYTRHEDWRGES